MSFKSRFEKPPNPLPTATQHDLEEMSRKKIASISDRVPFIDQDQRRPDDHGGGLDDQGGRPQVDHRTVVDHKKVVDHDKSHCPSRTERDKIGLRLPKHKVSKYKMYAWEHKISLQDLVEIALDRIIVDHSFVVDHEKVVDHSGRPQRDRSEIDSDDLKDRSVDDHKFIDTMNFYKEWTGNNITRNDEISYGGIEKYDFIDIKIGILQAVKNSKTPVRMLSYCCTVIKNNAKRPKPRYKYNKHEQLKDLMYEIEKKRS